MAESPPLALAIDLLAPLARLALVDSRGVRDERRCAVTATEDIEINLQSLMDAATVLRQRNPMAPTRVGVAVHPSFVRAGQELPTWNNGISDFLNRLGGLRQEKGPVPTVTVQRRVVAIAQGEFADRTENGLYISLDQDLDGTACLDGHFPAWLPSAWHWPVDPLGPICACGARGCLGTYASDQALDNLAQRFQMPRNQPASDERDLGLRSELSWRAAAGEAQALELQGRAARAVGQALGQMARVLGARHAVVHLGNIGQTAEILTIIASVAQACAGFAITVTAARLGPDAALLGSLRPRS